MPFVMHIHRQHCAGCGREQTLSNLYQADAIDSHGKANKLLPAASIGPLDPVHKLELTIQSIPVCHKCVGIERAATGAAAYESWRQTLARKTAPSSTPVRVAGNDRKRKEVKLEDLA